MVGDARALAGLRQVIVQEAALLRRVLDVMDRGGDFQLGPQGAHRELHESIRATVLRFEDAEVTRG